MEIDKYRADCEKLQAELLAERKLIIAAEADWSPH